MNCDVKEVNNFSLDSSWHCFIFIISEHPDDTNARMSVTSSSFISASIAPLLNGKSEIHSPRFHQVNHLQPTPDIYWHHFATFCIIFFVFEARRFYKPLYFVIHKALFKGRVHCPFRGCAGDWVKLGVAKRHGAVLGDAVSKMADENTKVQLVESDIPGAELPKPAEFCTVAILKRWLSCRGAKVSGNRKDLIKRLDYEPCNVNYFETIVTFAIGHVRYINILTWLRGFQVKLLFLVLFSLFPSLFWELRDKRNLKTLQF